MSRLAKTVNLTLFLLSFCHNPAFARLDTAHYHLQHFTDENGLPQNSVKFIAEDKAGYVWLATENGLVRLESGRYIRNFSKNELDISSSRISCLYSTTGDNELFALTEFHQLIGISCGKATVQQNMTANGNADAALIYKEGADTYPVIGLPNLYEKNIRANRYLIPAKRNSFFLIYKDSIDFIGEHQQQFRIAFHYTSPWSFFSMKGQLYYLNASGEAMVFNGREMETVAFTGDILQNPAYRSRRRYLKLYWNFAAEQTFVYLDEHCYVLQRMPDGSLHTRLVVDGFDFVSNRIMSVYYDAVHERAFLGSVTRGLYVFTRQPFNVLSGEQNSDDEVYYAQAELEGNQVLTAQGMLFDSAGRSSMFGQIGAYSFTNDRYSMVIDSSENVWYKNEQTLYKFNSKGRLLWQWEGPSPITQLYMGKDGPLWIGTKTAGLYRLPQAMPEHAPELVVEQLVNATYLQQETADLLWMGNKRGLYRLHIASRSIDTIKELNGKHIRSLNIPRPGEVWITTYDDGFFLYRKNRLHVFPLDEHKYLQTVHCLVEDDKGYCWITTNKGLFQAARKDLLAYADDQQSYVYYLYYGKDRGFKTNEFNGGCEPCGVKWSNGNISFPSMDGLVYFDPNRISAELPDKELYIEEAVLNGKLVPLNDSLVLPNTFQQLKLSVSTPYFGDAANLQVSYALTAASQEDSTVWLPLGNDHTLSFSTLPSGTYQLRIRKINGFGKNNYTEKVLLITVQQAYYETAWFRLLVLLALIIAFAVYTRVRTYKIKQQNRVLETRVTERTAELQTILVSLAASEKKLRRQARTQERLMASITHDIKTPMKYLMMLAGNMSWKNKETMGPEMMTRSARAIYDTSYRMYYLLENLIQYIRTHIKNGTAVTEDVDLHELLEEKIDIFHSIALTRSTSIVNNVPPDLQFRADYQVLAVVLHNLLDNAVKNTVDGVIRFSAENGNGKISIIVEDAGTGLPPAVLNWINGYHGLNGEATSPMYGGIGLLIVLELLELVNGKLIAENNRVKGATLKIELPAA